MIGVKTAAQFDFQIWKQSNPGKICITSTFNVFYHEALC